MGFPLGPKGVFLRVTSNELTQGSSQLMDSETRRDVSRTRRGHRSLTEVRHSPST